MIERNPQSDVFKKRLPEVASMYKDAFAGYPWFENLTFDEAFKRVNDHASREGFEAFIAEAYDGSGEIVGGLWYDKLSIDELHQERGRELASLAQELQKQHEASDVIWEREVLVKPSYQGQKIATRLRTAFLAYLGEDLVNGGIVLTRMRDDNYAIIKVAEAVGFQRTGIKLPSSQNPTTQHEYWYRIITAKR
jgi:RimJ/RimL family protein N-acetyltransferase